MGCASTASKLVELNGLQYVVVASVNGILGVYRVRSDNGVLLRLKRWPKEQEEA